MGEIVKARYINPLIDWGFKRLFGSEVNKDILIEFLKVIFPEYEIEDITYIPAEQLFAEQKTGRISLSKCSTLLRNTFSRGHCITLHFR